KIFCGSDFWHIKAQNAVNPAGFTSILTKRWRKYAPQKTGSDYTRHLTAEKLLDELQKSIFSLEAMPKRVALMDEEPWKSHGIHKMPVKNFIVYFWINDELK
ncbi:MAG: hypothetical protein IJO24_00170, partial [Clostridia bacterium]|nr:hypothetical protein [Clostridia bacterium]